MNRYAKAVVGALVAGLGALQVAQADNHVTSNEWVQIASAVVAALGLVWGVQNAPAKVAAPVVHLSDEDPNLPVVNALAHLDEPGA